MEITVLEEQGWTVVAATGRLDAATAAEFDRRVGASLDGGSRRVLFDFAGLEYISSAGLRSLLVAAKKLKGAGGQMALCRLSGLVKEVIGLSGFDALLAVYDTREEAVGGPKGT